MPRKKCGFGFSCAAMMLQPGLEPKDCPNYETCGSASELTPEEEVELIRVREARWERFRVSRHRAAAMMLMARGCSQSLESFGVTDSMVSLEERIQQLRSCVEQFTESCYVAPDNSEVHRYNVKRPYGTYWYNKLTSTEAIFEPEEKAEKVKVIHLSRDDDPRNCEGRRGIERRNRLHQLQTQLRIAEGALERAMALLAQPLTQVLADDEHLGS